MKIIYTNKDGSVSVIHPIPKKQIEVHLGQLTQTQYEKLVWERSVPADAINPRKVEDSDIPTSREFREAWVDVTPEAKVDVCCEKAKEVALEVLRRRRDEALVENDSAFVLAQKLGTDLTPVLAERERLCALTDPLKALDVTGKVNDATTLAQLKEMKDGSV